MVNNLVLNGLIRLSLDEAASIPARSVTFTKIEFLKKLIEEQPGKSAHAADAAFLRYSLHKIDQFFKHPDTFEIENPPQLPDGPPIGCY